MLSSLFSKENHIQSPLPPTASMMDAILDMAAGFGCYSVAPSMLT